MVKIDLHLHTNRYSPCSRLSPEELAAIAPFTGLDGIVVTEHNFSWTLSEIEDLQSQTDSVRFYRGVEADVREGHFLIIGADIKEKWKPGRTLRDLVSLAKEQDAALIWAHPGRFSSLPAADDLPGEYLALDGLEVMSGNIQEKHRDGISRMLALLKKPQVAGSDSHISLTVGTYATMFPELPRTEKELARMIKEPSGVPWANRKALIPINSKYKEDGEKLLLSAPRASSI